MRIHTSKKKKQRNLKSIKFSKIKCQPKMNSELLRMSTSKVPAFQSEKSQFKATDFWNEAVSSIKQNVELKRKRVKLKSYAECFSGSEVVDVAHQFLVQSKENGVNKEITREQAVKLCQLMLTSHIFEPVQSKAPKDSDIDDIPADKFRDSNSKLYRFLDDLAVENEHSKDLTPISLSVPQPACLNDVSNTHRKSVGAESICSNQYLHSLDRAEEEELLNITGHCKSRLSFRGLKRALTPSSLLRKTPSSSSATRGVPGSASSGYSTEGRARRALYAHMSSRVPPEVEDEIWREVALAQLLTLVEIPILELILGYEYMQANSRQTALTFTNLGLSRYNSMASLLSESAEDPWLEAAMDCLELLPSDAVDALHDACSNARDPGNRRAIYDRIASHYTGLSHPLWSNNFADLHIALLNILLQGRHDVVLKAVQLSFILLPSSLRDEITRLLMFMKLCVEDDTLVISTGTSNRGCLERQLVGAVMRSKKLNPHQCSLLVLFMMDRAHLLSGVPDDTEDKVATRLELEAQGLTDSPVDELMYCERVSVADYAAQTASATEMALVDLVNAIIDDTKMPLKEKRQRLQQFRAAHPQLVERHFSNLLD